MSGAEHFNSIAAISDPVITPFMQKMMGDG